MSTPLPLAEMLENKEILLIPYKLI